MKKCFFETTKVFVATLADFSNKDWEFIYITNKMKSILPIIGKNIVVLGLVGQKPICGVVSHWCLS